MYCRCPVCESIVEGTSNMVRHLTDRHKFSGKHQEILDSYILVQEGFISLKGDVETDDSQLLVKLIEKKCVLVD